MKRLVAQGTLLATALALCATLVVAPPASAHHFHGDQGPDHDWFCAYVDWIHVGYCQQSPIPEPDEVFPPEILVEHFVLMANGLVTTAPGTVTTIVTRAPSCLGTVDPNSRPRVSTGSVPDPLNVVPDMELVTPSGDLLDLWYCLGY